MLQFFKKWGKLLTGCLKNGDLQTIADETELSYHQVRRILMYSSGEEADKEKVLKTANDLIQKRSQSEQQLAAAFNKELLLEKEILATKAIEAVQQLSGTKEDLVNF